MVIVIMMIFIADLLTISVDFAISIPRFLLYQLNFGGGDCRYFSVVLGWGMCMLSLFRLC